MMAIALNRIYTPILRQQVSEIVDFFLPMEALSYKAAIISIDKAYPGQARRAADEKATPGCGHAGVPIDRGRPVQKLIG